MCYQDFVPGRLEDEIFMSKTIKRRENIKQSLALSAFRQSATHLFLFWESFLEEHLWTWGVSRPILTPQGLSSKAANRTNTQDELGPKNSSGVASSLSRQIRRDLRSTNTLEAIILLLIFGKTGDYYCTWNKVGCFPSCWFSLSLGPLVLWFTADTILSSVYPIIIQ